MTIGSRTEVISVLRRFVHGQLTFDELQGFVRSRNFGWLDELLDGIQLEERDYREIALDEAALCQRMGQFVDGSVSANAFADWSFETYRIFSSGSYPTSDVYSPNVEIALLMLCLLTECESSGLLSLDRTDSDSRRAGSAVGSSMKLRSGNRSLLRAPRTKLATDARRIAGRVLDALHRGQPVPAEAVVRRALQHSAPIRLQTRPRPEVEAFVADEELWADLALVTTPADRPPPPAEDCWFIPLAVCTRDLWLDNPPEGVWGHPENDRMHAIRDRFPLLDLETYEPMYFVGPDGIAEVVLATERIDPDALQAAVRLFSLRNRIRNCTLDGVPSYPSREDR